MGAVPRPRAFDDGGQSEATRRRHERARILRPRALVEVDGEEPAGLVVEHRVDAHHVLTLKMGEYGGIVDGAKRLLGAVTTLHPRQLADPSNAASSTRSEPRRASDSARATVGHRARIRSVASALAHGWPIAITRGHIAPNPAVPKGRSRSRSARVEPRDTGGASDYAACDTMRARCSPSTCCSHSSRASTGCCRPLQTRGDPLLPEGRFIFRGLYCTDRGCDCRRVLLQIVSVERHEVVATINYGFEAS